MSEPVSGLISCLTSHLLQTKCFICGIGNEYLDKVPHGFETHTLQEHNLANYLWVDLCLSPSCLWLSKSQPNTETRNLICCQFKGKHFYSATTDKEKHKYSSYTHTEILNYERFNIYSPQLTRKHLSFRPFFFLIIIYYTIMSTR